MSPGNHDPHAIRSILGMIGNMGYDLHESDQVEYHKRVFDAAKDLKIQLPLQAVFPFARSRKNEGFPPRRSKKHASP